MSAHTYVTCLVHRARVPRETAVAIESPGREPGRRRHICEWCIGNLIVARIEHRRALSLRSWRRTIDETAREATNYQPPADRRS